MSDIEKGLGRQIARLRRDCGLTQAQLAEAINVTTETISRLERGTTIPSISTVERISRKLGVEVKALFDFDYKVQEKNPADREVRKILGLLGGKSPRDIQLGYEMLKEFYRLLNLKIRRNGS